MDLIEEIKEERRKKRKKMAIVAAVVIAFLIIILVIFHLYHPTHYGYNDGWIKGKNIEQIEEKYGKFDLRSEDDSCVGYRVYRIPHMFFGEYIYYTIFFDDAGKAQKVGIYEDNDFGRLIEIKYPIILYNYLY